MSPAPRRLWQLPTFLAGLAAVWAAVTYVTPPHAAARVGDKVEALAAALDRKPPDINEIESLVKLLADQATSTPRSHYLIGSGYVAVASHRPTESTDLWKLALQHFEITDANTLDPQDAARMTYRAAKARAATGAGEPKGLIATLMNSPPGEDRGEVHRLIAECALRQSPPDLVRARDELTSYLAGQHRASPAAATRCKLKLADLNIALNAPEQSKKWLKDIGVSAAGDVQAAAKIALARQAYAEKNWPEAAALLEAALALPGLAAGEKGGVRFQIAEALSMMGNTVQAVAYYEQAAKEPGTIGGQAALRMAELRLADPHFKGKRSECVEWLERAAAGGVANPGVTNNPFTAVMNTCVNEGDFANAMRAAVAGDKVAGQTLQRDAAMINTAWGAALKKASSPEANAKLSAAAGYYANPAGSKPEVVNASLMQAWPLYLAAGDKAKAATVIDQILKSKAVDRTMAGKILLARADLLPANDFAGIKSTLEDAMTLGGPDANQARFKLGMLFANKSQELLDTAAAKTNPDAARLEAKQVGQFGQDLLKQCADLAVVPAESQAMHEQATFELGKLMLRDGKSAEAEARFKRQLANYPNGILSGYGRLWLVCALLQQHRADPANRRILEDALAQLQPLTLAKDDYLRTYGEIWTANTLIELGDFAKATPMAKGLMDKYAGKAEELVAGKLLFYAHLKAGVPAVADAAAVLDRMDKAFASLPAATYPNDPEYSQARWKTELPKLREELRKFQQ